MTSRGALHATRPSSTQRVAQLIQDRIIISIGSAWDFDPTSKHQLMKILARHNKIIWVNYHGSRRPTLTRRDLSTAAARVRDAVRGVRRVNDAIVQVTPMVIPGASGRFWRRLNHSLLVRQIRRAVNMVAGSIQEPVQVWSFAPDVPSLVGALDEELFLYYCVDEFSQFEGYDASLIAEAERRLMDRADLVVTSSAKLYETKSRIRRDVVRITHGVDFDHFSAAWRRPLQVPDDIRRLRGPIFGFFGLLHDWFDTELLANVARQRPRYNFVLIGEVKTDVSALQRLDNVHLLGRRDHTTLPAYCAVFDAALMLFKNTSMTENINPIKMYEYLAAGLRIVSAPLCEAERFREHITFAAAPDGFARACDRVLNHGQQGDRARISRSVRDESWESRVELLSKLIMDRTNARHRRATLATNKRHATPEELPADPVRMVEARDDSLELASTAEDA